MPEYSVALPLWDDEGAVGDRIAAQESGLGLSDELFEELERFAAFWRRHVKVEKGWDTRANRDQARSMFEHLAKDLRRELGSDVTLDLDFWP
jgi:methylaspartate ammonia-lyase